MNKVHFHNSRHDHHPHLRIQISPLGLSSTVLKCIIEARKAISPPFMKEVHAKRMSESRPFHLKPGVLLINESC